MFKNNIDFLGGGESYELWRNDMVKWARVKGNDILYLIEHNDVEANF